MHPLGPAGNNCPDFQPDPELKGKRFVDFLGLIGTPVENPYTLDPEAEQWEPDGASYYNGELILQPQQWWTREEQMKLLDTHLMFTGRCQQCEMPFPPYQTSHFAEGYPDEQFVHQLGGQIPWRYNCVLLDPHQSSRAEGWVHPANPCKRMESCHSGNAD